MTSLCSLQMRFGGASLLKIWSNCLGHEIAEATWRKGKLLIVQYAVEMSVTASGPRRHDASLDLRPPTSRMWYKEPLLQDGTRRALTLPQLQPHLVPFQGFGRGRHRMSIRLQVSEACDSV